MSKLETIKNAKKGEWELGALFCNVRAPGIFMARISIGTRRPVKSTELRGDGFARHAAR